MFSVAQIFVSIFGLALLMIVHEAGHMFTARAFGMRVTTFSIGFGPTFFKIEPQDGHFWFTSFGGKVRLRLHKHDPEKHGPTVYQVAMIPFLAYVQIAGMNPFEDHDPEDKGSYANASLLGRIATIAGGPLANYLFASVVYFAAFMYGGVQEHDTTVTVMADHPAAQAGLKDGDQIVEVEGKSVEKWQDMAAVLSSRPEQKTEIVVLRDGKHLTFSATPKRRKDGSGLLGVGPKGEGYTREVGMREAALMSVLEPPKVIKSVVEGLGKWARNEIDAELGGPVMMVKVGAQALNMGFAYWLKLVGALSAYLGAFNLVPFPALDGGRLMFLGYELATRRRPDARVEAHIHVVGLMMLLGLMLYVTLFNDLKLGG